MRRPARSTLFPYTTLFRSDRLQIDDAEDVIREAVEVRGDVGIAAAGPPQTVDAQARHLDRKSTRLNSSPRRDLVCRLLLEKKNVRGGRCSSTGAGSSISRR